MRQVDSERTGPVTGWFRTPNAWRLLADRLAGPVRLFSGGTATGGEAYAAAMLLESRGIEGHVLASDMGPALIETARRGVYAHHEIRQALTEGELSLRDLSSWFERVGDQSPRDWSVTETIRRRVTFDVATLGDPGAVPDQLDAALVRNVWRHLTEDAQHRLADELHAALSPGGLLVLGGGDLMRLEDGRLVDYVPPALAGRFAESETHSLIWEPR